MSNSWFRFKQFTIQQNNTSMKVCTDSCLFGAWSALKINNTKNILDIGTGTGLLAMMLAQKSGARIDAIESDPEAVQQARENITAGPWSERMRILESDVRKHPFESVYDFIISNPPFFESDLRSPEKKKNMAKHDESLTLEQLIGIIRSCLNPQGSFSILLPFHRTDYFERLALVNAFFLIEKLTIRQTPDHVPFRSFCLFGNANPGKLLQNELSIKDESRNYSTAFRDLMNEYYLESHW
jgi:tRNA1Val (adenine37-N6)-methyltransferase